MRKQRLAIKWGTRTEPIWREKLRRGLRRRAIDLLRDYPGVRYMRIIRHANPQGEIFYFALFGRGQSAMTVTLLGLPKAAGSLGL